MKCSKCNFENSDNAKFCQECGSKIEPQKKACINEECCDFGKYILPPETNFCPRCGYKIEGQGTLGGEKTNKTKSKKNESNGYINGHEYVDLGLPSGLKWATCNVGANSPEEYGDYYVWKEVTTKANWGGTWRMPTELECVELEEKCSWEWTRQGGKNGYNVTGPNGNSIFLPAAGYRYGSSLNDAGSDGYYWSSTPLDSHHSYLFYFYSTGRGVTSNDVFFYGHPVRLVSE